MTSRNPDWRAHGTELPDQTEAASLFSVEPAFKNRSDHQPDAPTCFPSEEAGTHGQRPTGDTAARYCKADSIGRSKNENHLACPVSTAHVQVCDIIKSCEGLDATFSMPSTNQRIAPVQERFAHRYCSPGRRRHASFQEHQLDACTLLE